MPESDRRSYETDSNGITFTWSIVIGLEVHAQINTESKLFSSSPTRFGEEANTQVSFIDAAFPGMLPVVNRSCIEKAILTGLAVDGQITSHSVFARKNYFYPDLPQGYQISQFEAPLVRNGHLKIEPTTGETKTIRIERIHVEQDAGKSLHDQLAGRSLIDLNRSGIGLMEIVTHPDMRGPEDAAAFVTELRTLLRTLNVCDGNMQEGSLRVDANVSVRKIDVNHNPLEKLGTRCEIKNLNSVRFMRQAISYEADRHIKIRQSGETIRQETRLYDSAKGITRSMRSKENAPDYRYFPDPDLPTLKISDTDIDRIRLTLPELPRARTERYSTSLAIKPADAVLLANDPAVTRYFEVALATCSRTGEPPAAMIATWMVSELFGLLNRGKRTIEDSPIAPEGLVGLLHHLHKGTVSGSQAKTVFSHMAKTGKASDVLIDELGLRQIQDDNQIQAWVDKVIQDNPDQVAKWVAGSSPVFGWLVGQTMKTSMGKANPRQVNAKLRERLGKQAPTASSADNT